MSEGALMRSNEAIFDAATFHVRQTRFGQRVRSLVSRFTTLEVAQKASLLERRPWLGGYVRKEVDIALTFRKYANNAYDHG